MTSLVRRRRGASGVAVGLDVPVPASWSTAQLDVATRHLSWVAVVLATVASMLVAAPMATGALASAVVAVDRAAPVAEAPARPAYQWPLAGTPRVIGPFDPPAEPWLPGHRGVDLQAGQHEEVFAAGSGTIAFAGTIAGVGVVSIVHPGGLRTTYEPVASSVHRGEEVTAGTPIGTVSSRLAHCPAGSVACLHWGLIRGDEYLDPLSLLGLGRVRLLPT